MCISTAESFLTFNGFNLYIVYYLLYIVFSMGGTYTIHIPQYLPRVIDLKF